MNQDPFSVLGVEPRFDLDLPSLEARHRELARTLHPDRYSGRPASERRMALDKAMAVNSAYRALRDPVTRAEALFVARGLDVGELAEPTPSPELLMDMMEVREELAAARRGRDGTALRRLGRAMDARRDAILAALGRALDAAETDRAALDAALRSLGELRYLRRFFEEHAAVEEELLT